MRLSALAFILLPMLWLAAGVPVRSQDAHDHSQGERGLGHSENHDWYQDLKQPGTGYSCCNGTTNGAEGDCRPTRAYMNDEGVWYALLEGRWVQVSPNVVLDQMAPDGRSHICANKTGRIY